MHYYYCAGLLYPVFAQARDSTSANHQVVANVRESVTAISAQLSLIAETLQHLPADTREHEQLMKTLLQLREEHDTLKRRLQNESTSGRKLEDLWPIFFAFDAVLGAALYEQQIRGDLRGEALWIRRIVTGTCSAVFLVLLQFFLSLVSRKNASVMTFLNTCLVTVRALLLAAVALNDLMRLPKVLQTTSADVSRSTSLDKVRERTARKLEGATR